jgi:NAD(P)-dependent dehydrogenase (short-subunit alcohol dehydrogenase family)
MAGKLILITGGNTGIGKEAAVGLASAGARVVITSRNEQRGRAARQEIAERSGNDSVEVMPLDLASFRSIRSFAADVLDRFDHVDVLVNNAGLIHRRRAETEDGFETTFGVNHLGHFLLTDLLLDRLRASAPSRIVVVSSDAHKGARQGLDFDDLQSEHRYRWAKVYSKSKLANIYFARELSRRLESTGVTANALHPGFVRSEFGRGGDLGPVYGFGIHYIAGPFAISPEKGARTSIYLASSPDVEGATGGYYYRCQARAPSQQAQDDDAARRLWDASEKLVASVPA